MNEMEIAEQAFAEGLAFPKNYSSKFLVLQRGEGVYVEDRAGNRYLDFGAGIAVNALGYGREDLARVAYEQMTKLIHVSNLYATEPAMELASELAGSGDFAAVHFGNSGAEANEAAIKYARLYSLRTRGEGHHRVLCFRNGFHGRTLGALSVTPTPKYQEPFAPLLPGVEVLPFNDAAGVETTLDSTFAAAIVEPVQGEGGLDVVSPKFARALNATCRKHDVVLIADEVQTGLGRTGSLYASTSVGLEPDIVTLSKPLAGGLPLSATLIPARINDLLHVGEHGTTFGGGPVTCAVALAVWKQITGAGFLEGVAGKGEYLGKRLEELAAKYPGLGAIKGLGLLRGVVAEKPDGAAILDKAREEGLLLLRSGVNVLRLAPPLVISEQEIGKGIDILDSVIGKL
jgi:acetylornithine/N-succinyldiaminopimelate aminotransferase